MGGRRGYKGLKYIWSNGPTSHKPETSQSLQMRTKEIKNRNSNDHKEYFTKKYSMSKKESVINL